MLLNLEGIKEHEQLYEQNKDEALGMFLEGIKSTNSEIQEHLDNEKSMVSQIIKSELNHDLPTGKLISSLQAVKLSSLAIDPMFNCYGIFFLSRPHTCQEVPWLNPEACLSSLPNNEESQISSTECYCLKEENSTKPKSMSDVKVVLEILFYPIATVIRVHVFVHRNP